MLLIRRVTPNKTQKSNVCFLQVVDRMSKLYVVRSVDLWVVDRISIRYVAEVWTCEPVDLWTYNCMDLWVVDRISTASCMEQKLWTCEPEDLLVVDRPVVCGQNAYHMLIIYMYV